MIFKTTRNLIWFDSFLGIPVSRFPGIKIIVGMCCACVFTTITPLSYAGVTNTCLLCPRTRNFESSVRAGISAPKHDLHQQRAHS